MQLSNQSNDILHYACIKRISSVRVTQLAEEPSSVKFAFSANMHQVLLKISFMETIWMIKKLEDDLTEQSP